MFPIARFTVRFTLSLLAALIGAWAVLALQGESITIMVGQVLIHLPIGVSFAPVIGLALCRVVQHALTCLTNQGVESRALRREPLEGGRDGVLSSDRPGRGNPPLPLAFPCVSPYNRSDETQVQRPRRKKAPTLKKKTEPAAPRHRSAHRPETARGAPPR